nr:GtrA family protein [Fictibacillus macauensis]
MNHSFVRFLVVGVLNTLVGLSAIYVFMHAFSVPYWGATFLGNAIGACVSYVLNRTFTFQSKATYGKSIVRFALVIFICYVVAYFLGSKLATWAFALWLPRFDARDVAVLLGTGFYTILNYIGQRWFVFSQASEEKMRA